MSFLRRLKQLLGGGEPLQTPGASESRPLTCLEALERIQEFLDGELVGVSQQEVAHHFSICKRCYPHLRLEERFREGLRRAQEGQVCPEHVKSRILDLLVAEAGD